MPERRRRSGSVGLAFGYMQSLKGDYKQGGSIWFILSVQGAAPLI